LLNLARIGAGTTRLQQIAHKRGTSETEQGAKQYDSVGGSINASIAVKIQYACRFHSLDALSYRCSLR